MYQNQSLSLLTAYDSSDYVFDFSVEISARAILQKSPDDKKNHNAILGFSLNDFFFK